MLLCPFPGTWYMADNAVPTPPPVEVFPEWPSVLLAVLYAVLAICVVVMEIQRARVKQRKGGG